MPIGWQLRVHPRVRRLSPFLHDFDYDQIFLLENHHRETLAPNSTQFPTKSELQFFPSAAVDDTIIEFDFHLTFALNWIESRKKAHFSRKWTPRVKVNFDTLYSSISLSVKCPHFPLYLQNITFYLISSPEKQQKKHKIQQKLHTLDASDGDDAKLTTSSRGRSQFRSVIRRVTGCSPKEAEFQSAVTFRWQCVKIVGNIRD